MLQQRISNLSVADLCDANNILNDTKTLNPTLYCKVSKTSHTPTVYSFSDAAFDESKSQVHGQSEILNGIVSDGYQEITPIFHGIDWASVKQRQLPHSSYEAEILAYTEADDRAFYSNMALNSLLNLNNRTHCLHVDSKGLRYNYYVS